MKWRCNLPLGLRAKGEIAWMLKRLKLKFALKVANKFCLFVVVNLILKKMLMKQVEISMYVVTS
jgi:hypothetical protein